MVPVSMGVFGWRLPIVSWVIATGRHTFVFFNKNEENAEVVCHSPPDHNWIGKPLAIVCSGFCPAFGFRM